MHASSSPPSNPSSVARRPDWPERNIATVRLRIVDGREQWRRVTRLSLHLQSADQSELNGPHRVRSCACAACTPQRDACLAVAWACERAVMGGVQALAKCGTGPPTAPFW